MIDKFLREEFADLITVSDISQSKFFLTRGTIEGNDNVSHIEEFVEESVYPEIDFRAVHLIEQDFAHDVG